MWKKNPKPTEPQNHPGPYKNIFLGPTYGDSDQVDPSKSLNHDLSEQGSDNKYYFI